jgi:hypothetical protein
LANWVSAVFKTLIRTIAESTYPSIINPHIILKPKYPTTAKITATAKRAIFLAVDVLLAAVFAAGVDIPSFYFVKIGGNE